jgi:hypothetical protein
MSNITSVITWEGYALLFALFGIVAIQVLTGHINTSGLLMKKEGNRSFSPERLQLLLATLASAFAYLSKVARDPAHFPDISQSWLMLYGGSHAFYLGRRFYLNRSVKARNS